MRGLYDTIFLMIESRIAPYFKELGLSLREITGDEINDFYVYLRSDGLSSAVTTL